MVILVEDLEREFGRFGYLVRRRGNIVRSVWLGRDKDGGVV